MTVMKSFSNAGATNRHMFWSQPKPCAKIIARSPEPLTWTLFRSITPAIRNSPSITPMHPPALAWPRPAFAGSERAMETFRLSGLRSGSAGTIENVDLRFFEFFVRRLLDAGNAIACVLGCQDQLVEFQLQGQRVAVLRRLDQKDHQKRHDRRARVDNELPGIAEAEQGTRDSPDKHDDHGQEKGRWSAGNPRGRDGQPSEPVAVRLRYRGCRAYWQVCAHLNKCLAVNEV